MTLSILFWRESMIVNRIKEVKDRGTDSLDFGPDAQTGAASLNYQGLSFPSHFASTVTVRYSIVVKKTVLREIVKGPSFV
jgi:hypothetical protein